MARYRVVEVVLKDGRKFEGVLIPKTEFSGDDIIILKLKNGYNIGISEKKIIKIVEKGEYSIKTGKVEAKDIEEEKEKVGVVITGGTISSAVDYVTGGVSPRLPVEDLFSLVPEVFESYSPVFVELMRKLSEDMVPENWVEIAKTVEKLYRKEDFEGIVVLHGTDTMHYTASALSFMLPLGKPVILTGAQRSADRPSTDARDNLLGAFMSFKSNLGEVAIAFHLTPSDGEIAIIRGNRARKMHSTARAAFWPINMKILGKINTKNGDVVLYPGYYEKAELDEYTADTKIDDRVAIVKVFPGSDPDILLFYRDRGYRGIIIEGTGMGHVPVNPDNGKSWIEVMREVKDDMFLAVTSQTIFGRLHKFVYTNLREVSKVATICEDMTTEAAYTKLMWVLGHTRDFEEVAGIMLRNLRGEISERTEVFFGIPEFLR